VGFRVSVLGSCIGLLLACQQPARQEAVAESTQPPRIVTFNRDVAPILFANCATCHRPVETADGRPAMRRTAEGRVLGPLCVAGAPFSLLEYESAQTHAKEIAAATKSRAMPPWLPEPSHAQFLNERRLRDEEIATIQQWVAQGAPEGDPAERPHPPTFADGWQLGTPDLVLSADTYTLEPANREVFRNFVIPVPGSSTRYVRAVEFRADNPQVLHHASLGLDPTRVGRQLDRADPGPGFATMPENEVQNVFGWSPGKVPILEPADTAWPLEQGSDLVVQLHMVASGTRETVQPKIGLFFTSTPPTRVPIAVKLESKAIDIPAGDSNYVIEDSYVLPVDVDAVSVYPHAHYLAKEMTGTATLPDGTMTSLIRIRQWDVRWQDQYRFRTPISLPRGTTLRMRFTYDNSETNKNNRHAPPQRVRWGPQSTDEMGALWLEVIPRDPNGARALTRDYFRRALLADTAAAELQARSTPTDAAAHNRLAMKYVQAGRLQEAQDRLNEALRLKPDNAEALSNLGTVLQLQGRLPEATQHLAEAARLKPGDDRIRFNLGNGMHAAGRLDEAVREYRRAIQINPENADAHFNLAMVLGPQNRLDEAIAHLRRAIEINPQNADAHRNLALAYGLQGRIDEAIQSVRTALRIQPESTPAQQQLAQLLAAQRTR
jgi:Flp pilus assembly protein TadD